MKFKYLIFITIITLSFAGCNSQNKKQMPKHLYTNDLIKETSPYLLEHAHNPVHWHAWHKKVLEMAKKENKLLIISIGYAACHWCHVMEHESFEDTTVAKIMNDHFISIKVDREERPDVDQIYMNAVQLLTGRGGWPLNIVALPDGRPIWGGTYLPKKQWKQVLTQLAKLYESNPKKAEEYASNLTKGIKQSGLVHLNTAKPSFNLASLSKSVDNWMQQVDLTYGGKKGSPKFPLPNNFQFLLRFGFQTKNKAVLDYVNTTLTKMAYGGIYDQVNGGFSRYSTDSHWHIPHFEKMLYDNGQLVSLYANAYLVTKNPLFKQIVYQTTKFVENNLHNSNGAFYSSLDADSKNKKGLLKEGAYYSWTKPELQHLLKSDFNLFADYYNVNATGKWGKNNYILIRTKSNKEFEKLHNLTNLQLNKKLTAWRKVLLKARSKKSKPRLDDKTLTSWNAIMLKGYVDAYRVFNDQHFLDIAIKNANFIVSHQLRKDGGLNRNYKNNHSNINAYLDDYANVGNAFINLYEVTLNEKWLQLAKQLTNYCFDHFFAPKNKMFYYTSNNDHDLITRKFEIDDNVIPSSNSVMANNLFLLSHYYSNNRFATIAKQMLNNVKNLALKYPSGSSNWLNLYTSYLGKFYEIAIVGKNARAKLIKLNAVYIPNKLIAGSTKISNLPLLEDRYNNDKTLIYICVDSTCQLPVSNSNSALKQIRITLN